jgi:hypothetical protein
MIKNPLVSTAAVLACILVITFMLCEEIDASCFKEKKYSVNEIPDELKHNAKAVVRYEESILTISSSNEATFKTTFAITILNGNALALAEFKELYNKRNRIGNISGDVYNAEGERVEQIHADDIIDQSAISFSSLYDDTRLKYYQTKYRTYPFTVIYSFERKLNGYLNFPDWIPCKENNISVQISIFKIIVPQNLPFRYINKNTNIVPDFIINEDLFIYTWKLENIKAFTEEPLCESILDYSLGVLFAPIDFKIENFPGSMNSWETFGKWINSINKGRDYLCDERRQFLIDYVKDCNTDFEKAKKIYAYFQQKTRYVSIQIGIGGWQPMKAEDVDRFGYGDCKALVNYLKSLLSAIGIKSFYTMVKAGEDAPHILRDFPCQQFNHAVLCLPLDSDTIWIECTNQHIPFGYLGKFTDDRDVLIVTDEGGQLAHTRVYQSCENIKNNHTYISLDNLGNATFASKTVYSGMFFDEKFAVLNATVDQKKKFVYENCGFSGIALDSYSLKQTGGMIPRIEAALQFSIARYAGLTVSHMLVQFNGFNLISELPKKVANRSTDVIIKRSYNVIDTIKIKIPDLFKIESLPSSTLIESLFGQCEYSYKQYNDTVTYIRKFSMLKGRYAPNQYIDLIEFLTDISLADNAKMSLVIR